MHDGEDEALLAAFNSLLSLASPDRRVAVLRKAIMQCGKLGSGDQEPARSLGQGKSATSS